MDLWIRSQDKTNLCKIAHLIVRESQNENNEINYEIQDIYTMGVYKTKERALEVLDEINEIKYYKYMASLDWTSFASSVLKPKPIEEQKLLLAMMNTYVMPKE